MWGVVIIIKDEEDMNLGEIWRNIGQTEGRRRGGSDVDILFVYKVI